MVFAIDSLLKTCSLVLENVGRCRVERSMGGQSEAMDKLPRAFDRGFSDHTQLNSPNYFLESEF